jgi:C-terminal processing protease CtpA/Prc
MRKHIFASIVLLPLLLGFSHAAQNVPEDPPNQTWILSSDDNGSGSYLGVDIADVSGDRVSALKLKEEKGVEVNFVDPDGPAGKSGMKEHDVVLSMNGTSVDSAAQLRRMIHETPAGRVVTLGISRDGQPLTLKVQLGDKHNEMAQVYTKAPKALPHLAVPAFNFTMPDIDIPSMNMVVVTQSARSGLTVENITPQLGEFFGVKNGNGVLVRAVDKGSRAEKAGFHAGDVIVKINDQTVHDTSDFTHAVRSRDGNSVNVGVIREKKEQNLNLTLPDRKDSGILQQLEESDDDTQNAAVYQLSELQDEMAKLRPQMELAAEQARKSAEEVRKTLCSQQKTYLEQARKMAEEQREKLRKEQEELRNEMQRMQQELRHAWADI